MTADTDHAGRTGQGADRIDADGILEVGADDSGMAVKARSQKQMVTRRFFRHRLAMVSLAVLIGVIVLAYAGLWFWDLPYDQSGTVVNGGQATIDLIPWIDGDGLALGQHPFGQDNIGRDYFAVTLKGAQGSITVAILAGLIATTVGTIVGALAGFYRGKVDSFLMRIVDVLFTIPLLLLAAVIGRRYETEGVIVGALIIACLAWLTTARVIRAEFLSLREKEFVEAARALGASNRRIIWKHMLPNVIGSVIVSATLLISAAILIEAALAFLGFGVTDQSLGQQVQTYRTAFNVRPWLFWWPGIFIIVIALTINFIGDGLRDAFDPKQTRVRQ
ncbi:ABC transporter permease [Ilumatobacter nonamiensis]|uniref:ABC transporter permease n=1 Tax=Ilumatobacter nonamiensis TaxID=467093 RepID=UPI00034C5F15|nr:ABC transporter permease [Ilumatobacter nonamiensis]